MAASNPMSVLFRGTFLDLSQPIYSGCPGWAAYPDAVVEPHCTIAVDGFNAERLAIITHTGTHLDVPYHFFDEGQRIDDIPADRFQGPAVVLDLRPLQPAQAIGVAELAPFAGTIRPDDIVLLCTGWGERRSREPDFMYHWPYLSGEGAHWLLDRGAGAVGIDALSIGGWAEGAGRPPHEVLLGAGRWILEDIWFPPALLAAGHCHLFAFPILLQGCGGAFVRAVAHVDGAP